MDQKKKCPSAEGQSQGISQSKRELALVIQRLKGQEATNWLFEEVLTEHEQRAARKYIKSREQALRVKNDAPKLPHCIDIYAFVRQIPMEIAAVELGLLKQHLSEQRYRFLLRKLSPKANVDNLNLRTAKDRYALVVDESRRLVIWKGKEIDVDFYQQRTQWQYFWKLAKAASERRPISPADFSEHVGSRCLRDWKHRLTSPKECSAIPAFPPDLADLINVRDNHHRLDLSPAEICILPIGSRGVLA